MSIANEITRLQGAKADIKTAIEAKGVTVPSSATLDDFDTYIGQISGGGGSTGFPAWMKDGDTHIWLDIQKTEQLEQNLRLILTGTVDWGDGNTESVSASSATTLTHTYSAVGKYRIDLKPSSGTFKIGSGSSYNIMGENASSQSVRGAAAYQIEIGSSRITELTNYALSYLKGLIRLYIPDEITTIGSNEFRNDCSLRIIEFEDASKVTSNNSDNQFYYCYSLQSNPPALPTSRTAFTGTYYYCQLITEATIPATVTSLPVTGIGYTNCLKVLNCLPANPPAAANADSFKGITSACVIKVPNSSLNTYKAAQYWSAFEAQMVGV